MIDKQTINKESFLLILPKVRQIVSRKPKDTDMKIAKWMAAAIIAVVALGGISMIADSSYIDIDNFIAAMMMMPDVVLEWARAVPLERFINKIYLPTFVLVAFVFIVAKLKKPKKKDD